LLTFYLICVGGFLSVSLRMWVNVYDEGLAVLDGARVLGGEIPYRDFWTVYPPGQSYALAGVYRLLGTSLLAARAYDTVVRFAIVIGVYLVARQMAALPAALASGALSALWLGTVGFHSYGLFAALVFALFATWSVAVYTRSERRGWLLLAGVLTGLATLWRIDVAAYLGIALTTSLLVGVYLFSGGERARGKHLLQTVGLLVGGAALASAPLYVSLAVSAGIEPMWQQLVVFPAAVLGRVRRLPYPELLPDVALFLAQPVEYVRWARFFYPPLIYAISLIYLARSWVRAQSTDREARIRLVTGTAVTVFGLLLFAQALSRYDWIHVLPATIWACMVTGLLVSRVLGASWKRWSVAAPLGVLLGAVLITYILPPVHDLEAILRHASPLDCHSSLGRASCAVVQPDQERAVAFVRARTEGDEPVFVGNARHDQILINDVIFYYLAARPPATRYHELHPGVATTLTVQREIVDEIQAAEVTWVVTVEWPRSTEPNESAVSSGVAFLDAYIQDSYQPVAQFGRYTVWRGR
jgi:hypothetical protein